MSLCFIVMSIDWPRIDHDRIIKKSKSTVSHWWSSLLAPCLLCRICITKCNTSNDQGAFQLAAAARRMLPARVPDLLSPTPPDTGQSCILLWMWLYKVQHCTKAKQKAFHLCHQIEDQQHVPRDERPETCPLGTRRWNISSQTIRQLAHAP